MNGANNPNVGSGSHVLGPELVAFREIAEVSNDGVLLYHIPDKELRYINKVGSMMLGLSAGASLEQIKICLNEIAPNDREYLAHLSSDIIARGTMATQAEFVFKNNKGEDKVICCDAYRIGAGAMLAIFLRDITKAKEHEGYLVEFGARKNTVLDTLTHHISGALMLMRHLTGQAEKSVATGRDGNLEIYLGLLQENTSQCLAVINDLLKKEHELSPRVFVKNSRIDLVEKISIIHNELIESFRSRQFIYTHPESPLYINADDIKLLQVVNNLTSNAIKFSQTDKPITIHIGTSATKVIVSVIDRGIGIPDVLRPMIFQRQIGIGRTGLNGEKSIGLGLSICKNLVTLMGGEIWFESQEDIGSTFSFSLPRE